MSPQATRVRGILEDYKWGGVATHTIASILDIDTAAVRRCLGELRANGYSISTVPGTRLRKLAA